MKRILKVLLVVLIVLVLGFLTFIGYQTNLAVTNLVPEEQTREAEVEFLKLFDTDEDHLKETYGYEQIEVENSKEHYQFLVDSYGEDSNADLFILIHGLGGTGRTMIPYGDIFLERGYSVMMYDQQNSGHHPILKNNMGIKEKQDLIDLIHYVREQSSERKINIFAESYGAHTLLHAYPEIKDDIHMIILDSPMGRGEYPIDQGLKQAAAAKGIPFEALKSVGSAASKVIEGYSYSELNGISKVDSIDNPILIISNEQDDVTPHEDAQEIYNKATGDREMVLSHSKHAAMYATEKERYLESIDEFLERNR